MKVHEIRKVIEQWAKAQERVGGGKQADALFAFSKSLALADKLTMTTMLKKIEENKKQKND